MSHHKVEACDIYFTYPDGYKAIDGVNFRIYHGESVGIVGANGAGKSTLLMLLMGVLFPTSGEVIVGDIPVTRRTLPMIRERMGLVFQDPDDQLFMTTVFEDVAFGPRNYKLDEKEVEKRVLEALDMVGITHIKDRAPFKLSGGEKRATAIATVLSMRPDILVMDEPTAALDPKSRSRVMGYLSSFEHTKIITSHDLDMISEICDRTIVMKKGEIIADGPTIDILTNQELMNQSGLEVPPLLIKCPVCGNVGGDRLRPTEL